MNSRRSLLSAFVVLLAVACGRPPAPPPGQEVRSQLPRELTAAPAGDLQRAVANNSDFAFELLRQLKDGDQNLFFSPCMTRTHEFTSMRAQIFLAVAAANVARSLRTAEGVQGEMENLWRDC